jgi:metaxin
MAGLSQENGVQSSLWVSQPVPGRCAVLVVVGAAVQFPRSDYVTRLMTTLLTVPPPLAKFFSYFPLKTYPPSKPAKVPIDSPLLWIHPPPPSVSGKDSVLSADVECLKWQAHIALRGLRDISARWDISQDGALNGRLPNLQVPSEQTNDPDGELRAAEDIPTWIDEKVGALDDLEGYKDVESRDESHAWIALLEGDVHAALVSLLKHPTPIIA